MENLSACPNCNSKLKTGALGRNVLYDSDVIKFTKDFSSSKLDYLCNKCGKPVITEAKQNYSRVSKSLDTFLEEYIQNFPVATLQNPQKWEYEVLNIVTGQSSMDNRVQPSTAAIIFGFANYNVVDLNSSVNSGEKACFDIIRNKTFLMGGNAVIGVDIDYSEFGLKGELMLVCVTGTAIKLKNIDLISDRFVELQKKLEENQGMIDKIKENKKVFESIRI